MVCIVECQNFHVYRFYLFSLIIIPTSLLLYPNPNPNPRPMPLLSRNSPWTLTTTILIEVIQEYPACCLWRPLDPWRPVGQHLVPLCPPPCRRGDRKHVAHFPIGGVDVKSQSHEIVAYATPASSTVTFADMGMRLLAPSPRVLMSWEEEERSWTRCGHRLVHPLSSSYMSSCTAMLLSHLLAWLSRPLTPPPHPSDHKSAHAFL